MNEKSSIQRMALQADGDVSVERLKEEGNRRQYKAAVKEL